MPASALLRGATALGCLLATILACPPAGAETTSIPYAPPLEQPASFGLVAEEPAPLTPPARGGKSAVLAFALSTLLAGTGQFYNGDWLKGVITLIGHLGGIPLFILGALEGLNGHRRLGDDFMFIGGITLTAGLKLWSMVDAPLSAIAINEEAQRQGNNHVLQLTWGSARLGIDPLLSPAAQGAQASLDF